MQYLNCFVSMGKVLIEIEFVEIEGVTAKHILEDHFHYFVPHVIETDTKTIRKCLVIQYVLFQS